MQYYKYTLKPVSPFVTYPASDTVFGQLCCMLKLMGEDLNELLHDYESEPFVVVSNMLLNGTGSTVPKIKEQYEGKRAEKVAQMKERKKQKQKDCVLITDVLNGIIDNVFSISASKTAQIVRNSISRISGGTEGEGFSPYSVFETFYNADACFHLYVYAKDEYLELVTRAIKLMGKFGFGKDASTGKGRFTVDENIASIEIDDNKQYNAVYTLGNCVFEGINCEMYYDICTRFGKHGGGDSKPFKNPVVMAKQGALLYMQNIRNPYIGKAIKGLSYYENTVHQGYSLYIPVEVGVKDE